MLTQKHSVYAPVRHVQQPPAALSACLQSRGPRLSNGRGCAGAQTAQWKEGNRALATAAGQSLPSASFDWTGGLGQLVAAAGLDGSTVIASVFGAVGRTHQDRRAHRISANSSRLGEGQGPVPACGRETGYNLKHTKDLNRMWKELRAEDPELVVASPPCTPFTPLQEWNLPRMSLEDAIVMIGDGLEHVATSCAVAKWQRSRGKVFLFEHPRPSRAWREECLQELMHFPDVYCCVVDMCAYGMRVGELLNRKRTMFLTNSYHIACELQRKCTGDHEHEPLVGGKAAAAAVYPPELCRAIVRGLKRHLRRRQEAVNDVPADMPVILASGAPDAEQDLDEFEDLLPEEVQQFREDVQEKKRAAVEVTQEDKQKVMKMHVNLGHPSRESFVRFLRAGRIREEVVRWVVKEFKCEKCESQVVPKAPRPAVVPKCYKPGVAVGLDIFYIPDLANKRSLPVFNMVDLGTNYQMVELVESKEPKVLWHAFWRTWCRTFGMPQYLSVDEGLEFRGDFTKWCADFGTIMFRAAGRSPWQQGRVERHGGLIKDIIAKARESASLESLDELRLLLNECEGSKNRFMNRSGYSPVQRQVGQWPRMPGSLMSDEVLDPALQTQDTSDEFDKLLTLRKLAQEAFMKLSCQRAADKAVKARPRLQRVFKVGDLVYVYRVLRQKKKVHGAVQKVRGTGPGRKATWVGPGHVLAIGGSSGLDQHVWRALESISGANS